MKLYNHFGRVLGSILLVAGIHSAFAKEAVNSDDADGSAVVESEEAEEASGSEVDARRAEGPNDMVEVFPEDSIKFYQNLIDTRGPVAKSLRRKGGITMITGGALLAAGTLLVITAETENDCDTDYYGDERCSEKVKNPSQVVAGAVIALGGTVTFFTGLIVRKVGGYRLRRVQKYETELQYWKDVSERTVSWRVQPIVDPLRGRGGMELALGF